MELCDFGGFAYKGSLIVDFYFFTAKRNKKLLRFVWLMIQVHFLYILGRRDKSRLNLVMFDCMCSYKDRGQVIADFWACHSHKLRKIPKDVAVISFMPEDVVKYAMPHNRVIALKPQVFDLNTKLMLLRRELGDIEIKTYFYGNVVDDSVMHVSQNVITPDGKKFVHHKKSFKRMFFVREFLMYMIVGGINTLCGVVTAYLFSHLFPPMLAFVFGYLAFLLLSYYLNTKLTFRDTFSLIKFFKFCVAYIPSFIIQFLLAGTLISAFGDATFLVYVLTVVAGIPLTFVVMRFFSFAKSKSKKQP